MYAIRSYYEGKVHFHGVDIYDKKVDPVSVRRSIGMVFQQPNPFSMSIFENVAFGLRLNRFKGNMEEKVEKALVITSYSIHYTKLYDSKTAGSSSPSLIVQKARSRYEVFANFSRE